MKALFVLFLSLPVAAQAPGWQFAPICERGQFVGLMIAAPGEGQVAIRFDPEKLCRNHT